MILNQNFKKIAFANVHGHATLAFDFFFLGFFFY
jgi:hypothetical protein